MPTIQRSALVPHNAQKMFDLVNDVERYPEFLPWCSGGSILQQEDNIIIARVDMKKGPLSQHFSTRNELISGREIKMTLVDGPFKQLQGQWVFKDIGEHGCRVSFDIEFSFSGAILQKTLTPVFNEICARMVDAFVSRAEAVYG